MEAEKLTCLLAEAITDAEVQNHAEKINPLLGDPVSDSLDRRRIRFTRQVCGKQTASAIPLPILRVGNENRPAEYTVVPDKTASNTSRAPALQGMQSLIACLRCDLIKKWML